MRVLALAVAALALAAAGCGSPESSPPVENAPAAGSSPSYVEISPVEIAAAVYIGAGNECMIRLTDETDGAQTTFLGGGRVPLAVCGRDESGDWWMVDGALAVETITGQASIVQAPPENPSALAGAPASLAKAAIGHVRITATFGDLTAAGVLEIVAD